MHKILSTCLLSSLLIGCISQPKKTAPPRINSEIEFSVAVASAPQSTVWWKSALNAPTQQHITKLLQNNLEIRLAASKVDAAKAKLKQADAEQWLNVTGSASSSLSANDGNSNNNHSISLNASLPLDLFDRLKKSRNASSYDLAESLANLENTRLNIIQQYLLTLIDGSENVQLQALLSQQIETAQTLLNLIELRFAQGLASSVDVLQQREQLASLQQQLPNIALQNRTLHNTISELQANTPNKTAIFTTTLPTISNQYAISSPQQLLDHRPDLIALRAALAASDQRYEATLRERLPSLSLDSTALLQLASGNPSAIFSAAVDASVSAFDSGSLKAKIAEKNADLAQAGIQYLQAWLAAVRETDNLLHALQTNEQELQHSDKLTDISNELFDAAQQRYKRGVSDYLPVLSALRSLQQQQRNHLNLRAEQQRIRVRLHTAMGLAIKQNAKEVKS